VKVKGAEEANLAVTRLGSRRRLFRGRAAPGRAGGDPVECTYKFGDLGKR